MRMIDETLSTACIGLLDVFDEYKLSIEQQSQILSNMFIKLYLLHGRPAENKEKKDAFLTFISDLYDQLEEDGNTQGYI